MDVDILRNFELRIVHAPEESECNGVRCTISLADDLRAGPFCEATLPFEVVIHNLENILGLPDQVLIRVMDDYAKAGRSHGRLTTTSTQLRRAGLILSAIEEPSDRLLYLDSDVCMQRILPPNHYPGLTRYGAAVGLATLSIIFSTFLLHKGIRLESPWMLTSVTIAAWFGGLGPGLLSTTLCFTGQVLLRYPEGTWRVEGQSEWIGLTAFLMNDLLISFLFRSDFLVRAWRKISRLKVTGGYWWQYDIKGKSIELNSPSFPHLTITRPYSEWLRQVVRHDRERVEAAIQSGLSSGQIDLQFHMILPGGGTRLVEMRGVLSEDKENRLLAVGVEMGTSFPDPLAFLN